MNKIEQLHLDSIDSCEFELSSNPEILKTDAYLAASKSAEITEQIDIEFAEFVNDLGYTKVDNTIWKSLNDEKGKTSKKLFQEFLKQRK